jgi:4-diphosphocytidyl-2-C-methyl-D-erythritol kinase
MTRVTVRAPAKINLTLSVGPRRADGFHDVRTLLQSIALADTLTVSRRRGPFGIDCDAPGVPTDQSNLVWKAAAALWTAAGRTGEPRDTHVKLKKVIPHAAGLGGGSADAAAALVALNRLWTEKFTRADLLRIGATIGSDVPFFLLGGTALGLGRGEDLVPAQDVRRLDVIIIQPAFGVGTADAYRWLDEDRAGRSTTRASQPGPRRSASLGWPTDPVELINDLQGPVSRRHPEIEAMVDACYKTGAEAAAMTGSGSAVFGLFRAGKAAAAARRVRRPGWSIEVTRTLNRREAARRIGL